MRDRFDIPDVSADPFFPAISVFSVAILL